MMDTTFVSPSFSNCQSIVNLKQPGVYLFSFSQCFLSKQASKGLKVVFVRDFGFCHWILVGSFSSLREKDVSRVLVIWIEMVKTTFLWVEEERQGFYIPETNKCSLIFFIGYLIL